MQLFELRQSPVINAESSALDFRQIMNAMAFPGRTHSCESPKNNAISADVNGSAQHIANALVSREVTVSFFDLTPSAVSLEWLRLSLRSRIVDFKDADFIFVNSSSLTNLDLDELPLGNAESPEKSTTLLVNVSDAFTASTDRPIRFGGPGVNPNALPISVNLDSVPTSFFEQRERLKPLFPMGLDVYFCSKDDFIAMPRTTTVTW